ncbi:MAG: hypothetical protein LW865_01735 [Betaproteobacteria bacterium]|jgi:hypothetical protein|nr:hypothetical protein [Betaproteobacteria bacterium]
MAAKSPKKIKIKDGRFLLPSLVYGFSAMFAAYFLFFGAHASLLRVYAGGTFVMLGLISACIAVGCYYLVCRMDKEQTRSD